MDETNQINDWVRQASPQKPLWTPAGDSRLGVTQWWRNDGAITGSVVEIQLSNWEAREPGIGYEMIPLPSPLMWSGNAMILLASHNVPTWVVVYMHPPPCASVRGMASIATLPGERPSPIRDPP